MEHGAPAHVDRRRFLLGAAAAVPLLGATRALARPGTLVEEDPLDRYIRTQMVDGKVPGLTATVIRDNRIVWARGYGWADVALGRRANRDTVFMMASISKTATATGVMRAVEDGLLDLDADVNDVLSFPVRNPAHPDIPITLRLLLTHTASIRDNWAVIIPTYTKGDSKVPLGRYLRQYLSPGGNIYHPARNYDAWLPGARYEYSNIGASLAAYLVEAATGIPFYEWCDAQVFAPLGMTDTGWHLTDVANATVAMPYKSHHGRFVPYGQYGYPDYPDGALRTSAIHLSHHLLSFMNFGSYGGARVLQRSTVEEMRREQFPDVAHGQGLIWYRFNLHGMELMGHNGGDSGVATQMFFRPSDGIGVIVLTNGDWHRSGNRYPIQGVMARLFQDAETL